MTPGERAYDLELAKSMRAMSLWIDKRSKNVSQMLLAGAIRIEALSVLVPVEPAPEVDPSGNKITQPASTPDRAKKLDAVRD